MRSLALEAGLRLRARRGRRCTRRERLSTSVPSSAGTRGDADAALLVVDADAVDALLGADVLDDPAHAVGVVAEHAVVGGAVDDARPCGRRRARPGPRAGARWRSRLSWSATQRMAAAPRHEPEAHAHGEAPPGSEAPRDGGGGVERRRQLLTGTGASARGGRRLGRGHELRLLDLLHDRQEAHGEAEGRDRRSPPASA